MKAAPGRFVAVLMALVLLVSCATREVAHSLNLDPRRVEKNSFVDVKTTDGIITRVLEPRLSGDKLTGRDTDGYAIEIDTASILSITAYSREGPAGKTVIGAVLALFIVAIVLIGTTQPFDFTMPILPSVKRIR